MISQVGKTEIDALDHIGLVLSIASKFVRSRTELRNSEEFSDGMYGLAKAIQGYDENRDEFSTFATRCITNQIVSGLRNRQRKQRPLNSLKNIESLVDDCCDDRADEIDLIVEIILSDKKEPKDYMEILKLHYLEGMTKTEIAKKFDLSVEAIRKRLEGTIARIQARYASIYEEEI